MGGSASEEFLAPAPTGEDTFVQCTNCDYAANTEAVEGRPGAELDAAGVPAAEVFDTPDTPTIDSLVEVFRGFAGFEATTAARTLKNVVVKLRTPGMEHKDPKDGILIVGVPGDRDVDMKRLEAAVSPAEVEMFEAEDFARHPELVRGYLGPQGLAEAGYTYKVDPLVVPGSSWITGANEAGRHAAHVTAGRDFTPDGTIGAAEVRAGDACPRCGHALSIDRGIEIGHIFQLGRKYTDAFQLDVLGPEGKPVRVTMGSYGIGVSRAVAVVAEQKYDELGLIWPREIAPADVHLVATGKDDAVYEAAERLVADLDAAGLRVLFDDRRSASPGVKFKDAELIGVPTIVTVGRGLAHGVVEVRDRASGERREVPLADAVATLAG
jgi:prolyl-tRNA synthetase